MAEYVQGFSATELKWVIAWKDIEPLFLKMMELTYNVDV